MAPSLSPVKERQTKEADRTDVLDVEFAVAVLAMAYHPVEQTHDHDCRKGIGILTNVTSRKVKLT